METSGPNYNRYAVPEWNQGSARTQSVWLQGNQTKIAKKSRFSKENFDIIEGYDEISREKDFGVETTIPIYYFDESKHQNSKILPEIEKKE